VAPSAFFKRVKTIPEDIRKIKKSLRAEMRTKRREAREADPEVPIKLRDRFLSGLALPPKSIIAAYHAIQDEMDPAPLLRVLAELGYPLCLPTVTGEKNYLTFRAYAPGDGLVAGRMGVMEPKKTQPELVPTVLLVPLLAFDRRGYRLGYGGGYYDRTLSILRSKNKALRAYGLAYATQEVTALPTSADDQPLDAIVTENEVIKVTI
jgi:5-formyltetrahydrofolate cyclo-ligase